MKRIYIYVNVASLKRWYIATMINGYAVSGWSFAYHRYNPYPVWRTCIRRVQALLRYRCVECNVHPWRESREWGERDVCGEVSSLKRVGEKEIVEGEDERASRRKTYAKIVCTREGIYWTRDKFRVNFWNEGEGGREWRETFARVTRNRNICRKYGTRVWWIIMIREFRDRKISKNYLYINKYEKKESLQTRFEFRPNEQDFE